MDLKLFEKVWTPFFFTIIFLWLLSISSILYLVITGTQPLIDTSVNLFYATLPIFVLSLLYVFLTLFIFAVYLLTFGRVKNKQLIAMRRRVVTNKHLLHKSTNKILSCTILNNYETIASIENHEMGSQKEPGSLGMIEEDDLCSIIIAARNEDSVIRRTVMDCLKQTYKKIEVIVVCHNCTDRTYDEARVCLSLIHI